MSDNKTYTTLEAARLLGISRALVLKVINSGQLPAYKIGIKGRTSSWRIKEADLEEYLRWQEGAVSCTGDKSKSTTLSLKAKGLQE